MSALRFFATAGDLRHVLEEAERVFPVVYLDNNMRPDLARPQFGRSSDIPNLGVLAFPMKAQGEGYLILPRTIKPVERPVRQEEGGVMYFMDELWNPEGVTLWPGGRFGQQCIIDGEISCAVPNATNTKVLRNYRKHMRKWYH